MNTLQSTKLLVKVCGMREAENIRALEQLFALHASSFNFWMGFIFWPKSSRYVSEPPACLPTTCKRVGVFVDAAIEDICQHISDYKLDIVQLHGQETPEFIQALRGECGDSVSIIKAFNIATAADLAQTAFYEGVADYFLFDTKGKAVGGNGEKFDWSVLADYHGETPFLLSGGIGLDDAERIESFLTSHSSPLTSNKCIGIDLNSRFETAPATKDTTALHRFLSQLFHNSHNSH